MRYVLFKKCLAVLSVLVLPATGLWAAAAEEAPAAGADKKYVTDPTTGKVIVAPQYGGSIAEAVTRDEPHTDTWWGAGYGRHAVNLLLDKMGIGDWALDRDIYDFKLDYTPLSAVRGQLAESWEVSPDELTYTFHIRPGVYWHDKPPMNGRELVAEDIVFNFHRMTGTGSGFTEKSPYASSVANLPI